MMNILLIRYFSLFILCCSFHVSLCKIRTSHTDDSPYTEFCTQAARNEDLFANFRRSKPIMGIVETVSYDLGQEYKAHLEKQAPYYVNHIATFKTSETVGNPITFNYDKIGSIAPTTLRYIHVAFDLERLFGSLDDLAIVEIGGGYGGQCKIISDLFKVKKYTIIDLPEALEIAKKFLDNLGVRNVTFLTPDQLSTDAFFDLAISNYAFSECTISMQEAYVKNIFTQSKNGYCICNQMRFDPEYYVEDGVVALLKRYSIMTRVLAEEPNSHPRNYVLVWTQQ